MSFRDELKVIEEKTTPIECINDIIECLESLYSEDLGNGTKKIPEELSKYSGIIFVALKQARLLKTKIS